MHYRITGPSRLEGRFRPSGNKNGALPILAGCLLADGSVTLDNVPEIRDVLTMLQILHALGAKVEHIGAHDVAVEARNVRWVVPWLTWFDNEWAYANRMLDVAHHWTSLQETS